MAVFYMTPSPLPDEPTEAALELAHAEMAVALAFLNRGPGPDSSWPDMAKQLSDRLAPADQTVLKALAAMQDARGEVDTPKAPAADLRAYAVLLQRQLDAITGKDISDIRHGDGDIDLAKRVVNLKNAADWLIHAVAEHLGEHDPTPSGRVLREVVHSWIRDDLDTGAQMLIGFHAPKLIQRLEAALLAAVPTGGEQSEPESLVPRTVEQAVRFWFEPWGAWKGAVWEDLSSDKPFSADNMLEVMRKMLPAPPSEGER